MGCQKFRKYLKKINKDQGTLANKTLDFCWFVVGDFNIQEIFYKI